jgi:hypothetical protein
MKCTALTMAKSLTCQMQIAQFLSEVQLKKARNSERQLTFLKDGKFAFQNIRNEIEKNCTRQ